MVDFAKALKEMREKGKFLGYCNKCDTRGRIYEIHFLPYQENLPVLEKRVKCSNCGMYQLESNLIPF